MKINDNIYSGFLVCGDCGSPMFVMSRWDLKDAYRCGEYHKRGLKGCTSHHQIVQSGKRVCPECRKELGVEPAPADDQMYFYLMGRIDTLIKQLRSMKKQNQRRTPSPSSKRSCSVGKRFTAP